MGSFTVPKGTESGALLEYLDSNANIDCKGNQEGDPDGSVVRVDANVCIFVVNPAPDLKSFSGLRIERCEETTYSCISVNSVAIVRSV